MDIVNLDQLPSNPARFVEEFYMVKDQNQLRLDSNFQMTRVVQEVPCCQLSNVNGII